MKRVLMVTYYFPPIGGPAVYPILKFCKYLPHYGWMPTVICGGNGDPDFGPDETLVKEIPKDVAVRRIDYPHATLWRRARGWMFDHHLGRVGHHMGFFLDFPCRFREWAERAFQEASRWIQDARPDIIWTSSPVLSAHFAGLAIRQRFGIPWVADFRDPWVGNPILMSSKYYPKWQLARQARAEAKVARMADRCIFAQPLIAEAFAERHRLPRERTLCVTCGYDLEDFAGPPAPAASEDKLRIVHTGSFYREYNPLPLYNALKMAAQSKPSLLKQLKLVFVGGSTVDFDIDGLDIEVLPRLPHGEAIAWMRRSDVQLVILPYAVGDYGIASKLFEYLAAKRPVLAIVPRAGTSAEIVRRTNAGLVADANSPDEIVTALETLLRMKRDRCLQCDAVEGEVSKYSYLELTGVMARTLDELCLR